MRNDLLIKFSKHFSVFIFILILLLTATGLVWFYVKPHQESIGLLQTVSQLNHSESAASKWDGYSLYAMQQTLERL